MTAGISSIPGKPALIEGVNELEGERLNSPPKLGGVPARPSSSTKGRAGGVVPKQVVARFYLGTTPSAPALVASRHFINGAATPPNLGGELSRLPIHSHLRGGRSHTTLSMRIIEGILFEPVGCLAEFQPEAFNEIAV